MNPVDLRMQGLSTEIVLSVVDVDKASETAYFAFSFTDAQYPDNLGFRFTDFQYTSHLSNLKDLMRGFTGILPLFCNVSEGIFFSIVGSEVEISRQLNDELLCPRMHLNVLTFARFVNDLKRTYSL